MSVKATFTPALGRAIGHIAALHPDDALTVEWVDGAAERVWEISTSGTTRQTYKVDDETGAVLSVGWWQ